MGVILFELLLRDEVLAACVCEAPDISLGPISHMFAYRLFSSMSYPNSQCLFSMLESNLRSSLVLTTGSSPFL